MKFACQRPDRRRAFGWLTATALSVACPATAVAAPNAVAWPTGRPTPDFSLDGGDGPTLSLASLRGSPVLLNFWASWCEPCRTEMPSLELLETRHRQTGLRVLAINFRETDATVRRFVEQTGLSLTVLRDRDGGVAKAYGVRIYPTTVAIDASGRARFMVIGEVDWLGAAAAGWLRPILETRGN